MFCYNTRGKTAGLGLEEQREKRRSVGILDFLEGVACV